MDSPAHGAQERTKKKKKRRTLLTPVRSCRCEESLIKSTCMSHTQDIWAQSPTCIRHSIGQSILILRTNVAGGPMLKIQMRVQGELAICGKGLAQVSTGCHRTGQITTESVSNQHSTQNQCGQWQIPCSGSTDLAL